MPLFTVAERYRVPIETFAVPSDISIFGTHWGSDTFYADYAGIAKKYAPKSILEIGVRFGYSAVAMCLGALAANVTPTYVGIDACYFSHPADPQITSNDLARKHLKMMVPTVPSLLFCWDTRRGLPPSVTGTEVRYDLVNVDGDHSFEGAYNDLTNTWPLVAPGGIVIVDDTGMVNVHRAICQFRDEHAGELADMQWHSNERGWGIFQKVGA